MSNQHGTSPDLAYGGSAVAQLLLGSQYRYATAGSLLAEPSDPSLPTRPSDLCHTLHSDPQTAASQDWGPVQGHMGPGYWPLRQLPPWCSDSPQDRPCHVAPMRRDYIAGSKFLEQASVLQAQRCSGRRPPMEQPRQMPLFCRWKAPQ